MDHVLPGHKVYSVTELKATLKAHGWKLTEAGQHNGHGKDKYFSKWE